jgi:adenylate cyclase
MRWSRTSAYGDAWGGMALRGLGRFDASVAEYKRYEQLMGRPAYGLAMTYATMGKRDSALAIVHQLEADARTHWVDPVEIAAAYAALGDRDHVMQWLQQAYDTRDGMVALFVTPVSPWWDSMRDDPRFRALLEKVRSTVWTS